MTNHPGLGVMIAALGGAGSDFDPEPFFGLPIEEIVIDNDTLRIRAGGGSMTLHDSGQSCCESRYMHTDDDLVVYKGAKLIGLELRDGPTETGDYGEPKECQFLLVHTDRGDITIANYNEHNGYYGGFWIVGNVEKKPTE